MIHLSFHHHKKVLTNKDRDSLRHKFLNNPYLDWVIIILISTMLSLICIGIGFKNYFNVQKRLNEPLPDIKSSPIIFNSEELTKVLKQYDNQALEKTNFLKGYRGVSDPSL